MNPIFLDRLLEKIMDCRVKPGNDDVGEFPYRPPPKTSLRTACTIRPHARREGVPEIDQTLILITLTFLLAGFVKGVIGLGLPTVAIGILSIVMAPVQAVALLIVPSLVTNVWQFALGPSMAGSVRRLWPMMAAVAAGIWIGGWAGLLSGDGVRASIALGFILILYALSGFIKVPFAVAPRSEPWLAPITGGVTGLIAAATGVFVLPAGPYLQGLGLTRDEFVQALGLLFTVSTVALAVVVAGAGMFKSGTVLASSLAVIPALAGMAIGQLVRGHISERTFRLCFFFGLFAIGIHLASRAFV